MSIHIKNHTYLTTEVVQVNNGHFREIMKEIFVFNKTDLCVNSYKKPDIFGTEVIQVKNDHSPEIMKVIFVFQENETKEV